MALALPIFLLVLPKNYFDQGQSISLFALLGVENYYSEGMTRACMHLIHLDFEGAQSYNALSFVVLPLLILVWAAFLYRNFLLLQNSLPKEA